MKKLTTSAKKLATSWSILLCLTCFGLPSWASKSGVSPQALQLPSGPGSLGGVGENVQANLNMGLMSYSIPIAVPPGRRGTTPNVSISYSSSAGSGLVGIGWSFNAGGAISRLTVRGLPTYTNSDRFYAGGELVKVPGSPFYRARIEGGFVRYSWIQKDANDQRGYWLAEYPNGSKGYFGANSKGVSDLDSQTYGLKGTFQWELRTMIDANGNRIEYNYFKEGSQVYLDTVSWVFDKNNKPLYQVSFQYETRPDPISDGKPGFDLQTLKRVKSVEITSAGQRIRSYVLQYEDATGLSRLIKVTRYGRDGKTPYPVAFSMKYSNATFSSKSSRLVTMPTPLGINFATGKADFLDINGDGLADVIDTSKSNHVFHINTLTLDAKMKQASHDFPQSARKTNSKATSGAQLGSASVQMIDYNGDGYTDMVDAVNKAIYINKGNGQWEANSGQLTSFPVNGKDANMRFFDYNGDKAIDVISSNGKTTTYWVSDSKGDWKKVEGRPNLGASVSQERIRFIDINGDGLNDAVQILPKSMRFKKYLGYGNWSSWIDVTVPGFDSYDLKTKAQFNDINGDGMADMVAFLGNSIVYFVNKNGKVFSAPQKITTFDGKTIPNSTKNSVRIADINGNGSRDIVWLDSSGQVTYLELFSERPNLLREISNGIGQRINVEYGSSVYFYLRDKSCKVGVDRGCEGPWKNKMPMAFTVVTRILTWASHSSKPAQESQPKAQEKPIIQAIYYHNGFYDGKEKQFRGFRKVESFDLGDTTAPTKYSLIEFNVGDTDLYFHGKMLRSVVMDAQQKVFSESRAYWKDCGTPAGVDKGLNPPVRFICRTAQETTFKDKLTDASKWKTTRNENEFDAFGNLTVSGRLGEKAKSGDEIYTLTKYIVPDNPKARTSNWNIRSIKHVARCEKKEGPCAEYRYYYDGEAFKGLPLGQLTKGNLHRLSVRTSLDKDEWLDLQMSKRDTYGNPIEKRGPDGQKRVIEYDGTYHKFATKETVFVGKASFASTVAWDYKLNAVARSTDLNGHTVRYNYDNFGRLLAAFQPGDTDGNPSVMYVYELKAPLSRIITRKRTTPGGPLEREQISCFDGLGRSISTHHKLADKKYMVFGHKAYNSRGKTDTTWHSYESDGTCSFLPPQAQQANATTFTYDSILRLVRKEFPDKSFERIEYQPLKQITHDEEDNRKGSPHYNTPSTDIFNGQGKLIERIKLSALNKEQRTKYTYTGVNATMAHLVTSLTYPDGSVKKHEYNLLGHVVKTIAPDRSTFAYKYDKSGNVIEFKDARGKILLFTFDTVGRMTSQQEKGKDNTRITYAYDNPVPEFPKAQNLKGRLSRVISPHSVMTVSYDANGTPIQSNHTMLGVTFTFTRTFNLTGELLSETWPDGRKMTYRYDQAGRLQTIPGFIESLSYDKYNMLVGRTMANQVKSSFGYTARQWLKSIKVASQPGFQLNFSYDSNGNIMQQQESYKQQHTHTYKYDTLYRLQEAALQGNASGKEILTYRQDLLDNITSKTSSLEDKSLAHLGTYTYDSKKIHAATQIGKLKLSYDDAGYMKSCGPYAHSWDHMGRLVETKLNGKVAGQYWYGESNLRIVKQERGLYSFYPFHNFRITPEYVSIFLKHGSNRIAEWRSSKFLAKFYDDLAPASGNKKMTPSPDGQITPGDAWLYHAARAKLIEIPIKKRDLGGNEDLTRNMLRSSLYRLLNGDKDKKYYLHPDHLGSIRVVTDQAGQVVHYKRYYPYGAIASQEGDFTTVGYQSTERDTLTGHSYFGARYLDTRLGKWLSPDPLFANISGPNDQVNSYGSVSNNPLRNRDVDGFLSTDQTLSMLGSIAMGGVALTYAIQQTVSLAKNGFAQGKKMNRTQGFLAASGYAVAGLAATAAALTISGDETGSVITAITVGALGTIRSLTNIRMTHQQHIAIKNFSPERYSKLKHAGAISARIASTLASVAATTMFTLERLDVGDSALNIGLGVAAAGGAVLANVLAVKMSLAYSTEAGKRAKFMGIKHLKSGGITGSGLLLGQSAVQNLTDADRFSRNNKRSRLFPSQANSHKTGFSAQQLHDRSDALVMLHDKAKAKKAKKAKVKK